MCRVGALQHRAAVEAFHAVEELAPQPTDGETGRPAPVPDRSVAVDTQARAGGKQVQADDKLALDAGTQSAAAVGTSAVVPPAVPAAGPSVVAVPALW